MYIESSLRGRVLQRRGEMERIKIGNGDELQRGIREIMGVGIEIDKQEKEMRFKEGVQSVVISGIIGVREPVKATILLGEGVLVCDIHRGVIYVEDGGVVYGIGSDRSVIEGDKAGIEWLEANNLGESLGRMVGASFNLKESRLEREYSSNLMFTVEMGNERVRRKESTDTGYLFRLRVLEYLIDIGLDNFDYKIEEDESKRLEEEQAQAQAELEAELERKEQEELERKAREQESRVRELEARYASIMQGEDYTEDVETTEDIEELIEGLVGE